MWTGRAQPNVRAGQAGAAVVEYDGGGGNRRKVHLGRGQDITTDRDPTTSVPACKIAWG